MAGRYERLASAMTRVKAKAGSMRVRHIAPVALVLGATIVGLFGARFLGQQVAQRDSERRAEVAAAQIRDRVEEGSSLADSLEQYVGTADVTIQAFEINALQWLSPAGLPAAGWVERVPASRLAAYERRTGQSVVTLDRLAGIQPVGPRLSYLPATLISGISPMNVPGLDLGSDPGFAAALARASATDSEAASPLATLPDGADGLFLIRPAPRLTPSAVLPGFVVLFESAAWLRAAATSTPTLRLTTGYVPSERLGGAPAVRRTFREAGQRFDVFVPQESVGGTTAALPWIILATGLVLAALAGALGANATRRARTQDELDRIFALSPDLITVANFTGHFTRVNPAAEWILGYTEAELLARPYLDFVHPDDREMTAKEAAAIARGKTAMSFENRYVCKDGSYRVLQWTCTPVVRDSVMYAVARDVTERRHAETELVRLADEQAALRRVATLVARGVPAGELFKAVTEEVGRLLCAEYVALIRYEPDGTAIDLAAYGTDGIVPPGDRLELGGKNNATRVFETGRSARIDDYGDATGPAAVVSRERHKRLRSAVATPIFVEANLWGAIGVGSSEQQPLPADTEARLASFTELLATAIGNLDSRDQLTASRARLVTEAHAARRRVVRDLHDGAQQWLVHTIITLKLARRALDEGREDPAPLVSEALGYAETANGELRELARGLLPSVLTRGGLRDGVDELAAMMSLPVDTDIGVERLPQVVEATAYFVVAEALTNVVKHARAERAEVRAFVKDETLHVEVRDNGIGGANPRGQGLIGLSDRVTALDGRLSVESPARGGTTLAATLPLNSR